MLNHKRFARLAGHVADDNGGVEGWCSIRSCAGPFFFLEGAVSCRLGRELANQDPFGGFFSTILGIVVELLAES
jgi:hypothetical protein